MTHPFPLARGPSAARLKCNRESTRRFFPSRSSSSFVIRHREWRLPARVARARSLARSLGANVYADSGAIARDYSRLPVAFVARLTFRG